MDHANSRLRDGLALTFASFFPLTMAWLYFVVLDKPSTEADPLFIAAYSIGKVIQFVFPAVYVWWFYRAEIRFAAPTLHGLVLGAGFGLLVGAAMFTLYFAWIQHVPAVSQKAPQLIYDRLQQFGQHTPRGYLQMAFFLCCVHSLWEEYYWRWFVFGWMRRHLPLYPAIVLSSVGFMLHHVVILGVYFPDDFWTLALPFSLAVAVGGGVWAWLYQRSGSLYAAWLSHGIIDAAIMMLGYQMLRDYLK